MSTVADAVISATNTASERERSTAPFRALDPELPRLAARAAFQLDNLRLRAEGQEVAVNHDAIEQLARRLQALQCAGPSSGHRVRIDPVTTGVLYGAVLQVPQSAPKKLIDVLEKVEQLADELTSIGADDRDVRFVSELRDFCLAISELSASRQRVTRSPRPYRVRTTRKD